MTPAVDPAAIARAVAVLERGGLVAFPTETVYGLGADADNPSAVRRIFAAKGRPADHPVIVHIGCAAALDAWARAVPPAAQRLAQEFWPGPLTLVLARSARAADGLTGGQDTVGLRCPSHPWAQALLQAFAAASGRDRNAALAAPSANSFGRVSPTSAAHVRADLGEEPVGRVDLLLDGGACPIGIESTIVDLSGERPRLLRPGSISSAQIEVVLGEALDPAGAGAPRASGGLEVHYAPRTPLELLAPADLAARAQALAGCRLAVFAPPQATLPAGASVVEWVDAPAQPDAYAHVLYAALHRLDAAGAGKILVASPPAGPAWDAIHDRLRRAAATSTRTSVPTSARQSL